MSLMSLEGAISGSILSIDILCQSIDMFAMRADSVPRAVIPGNAGSRGATVTSALKEPVERREAHAVVRRRAEALKSDEMLLAAIAAVGLPTIAGTALVKARHIATAP